MSLMLTRMFAYFTVVCYLVVGTVVARFVVTENVRLQISSSYFSILNNVSMTKSHEDLAVIVPNMDFLPAKKVARVRPIKKQTIRAVQVKLLAHHVKEKLELPFHETIYVKEVFLEQQMPTNLLASYEEFKFEDKAVALVEQPKQDEVSVKMAAPSKEYGEDFFEYSAKTELNKEVQPSQQEEKIETEEVANLIEDKNDQSVKLTETVTEPEFFDYPAKVTTQASPTDIKKTNNVNLIASLTSDVNTAQASVIVQKQNIDSPTKPKVQPVIANALIGDTSKVTTQYRAILSIQAIGTNLEESGPLNGFEARFQDSNQDALEDFGTGSIRFEGILANPKMTRTSVILKRGYVPTTTDIFLEDGEGQITIPLIEEETINNLNQQYEVNGVVGSLLIELDDETEVAKIDVPFGKVLKLNGDLKETESEDFRYQLFIGVRTGNAMISYHKNNGDIANKIVHVHENEMLFDANFYEEPKETKIKLNQEDLISKVTSPLNVPGDNVKIFATNQVATKMNSQTYRLNFGAGNLAGRRYIELSHQEEPIFIGVRDNTNVSVPSENLIRYMLSQFENSKLGDRCLVQINLAKEVLKFDAFAESAGSSLVLYNQALDSDGKFYESVSEKTRKLVIVGENQASGEASRDGKINIKIQYTDGTDQYLSSYCSPNTYLVEQL